MLKDRLVQPFMTPLNFCFGAWMSMKKRSQLFIQELGIAMGVYLFCKILWQTLRTFAIVSPFFDRILSRDNDGE